MVDVLEDPGCSDDLHTVNKKARQSKHERLQHTALRPAHCGQAARRSCYERTVMTINGPLLGSTGEPSELFTVKMAQNRA
jgi:hypothetical protein